MYKKRELKGKGCGKTIENECHGKEEKMGVSRKRQKPIKKSECERERKRDGKKERESVSL